MPSGRWLQATLQDIWTSLFNIRIKNVTFTPRDGSAWENESHLQSLWAENVVKFASSMQLSHWYYAWERNVLGNMKVGISHPIYVLQFHEDNGNFFSGKEKIVLKLIWIKFQWNIGAECWLSLPLLYVGNWAAAGCDVLWHLRFVAQLLEALVFFF